MSMSCNTRGSTRIDSFLYRILFTRVSGRIRTVTPMYLKPYVFGPKVFELISYQRYSATLCIRCRCYSIDGYSRSGCESLASHRSYLCLSLSLLLVVIVLLLTVIPAETSAAEQEWILFD